MILMSYFKNAYEVNLVNQCQTNIQHPNDYNNLSVILVFDLNSYPLILHNLFYILLKLALAFQPDEN